MRSLIVTGKRLFADPGQPRALRLIEASAVASDGVITARYEPRRA